METEPDAGWPVPRPATGARTIGGLPGTHAGSELVAMYFELEPSIAETMPAAYRRVLDAVSRLEKLGGRKEASRLRAAAIRIYAHGWDDASQLQLEEIALQLDAAAEALAADPDGHEPRLA